MIGMAIGRVYAPKAASCQTSHEAALPSLYRWRFPCLGDLAYVDIEWLEHIETTGLETGCVGNVLDLESVTQLGACRLDVERVLLS